jgi:hypothetical protein
MNSVGPLTVPPGLQVLVDRHEAAPAQFPAIRLKHAYIVPVRPDLWKHFVEIGRNLGSDSHLRV